MASRISIILLLVIVLASQYECAPSDTAVSGGYFDGVCVSEFAEVSDELSSLDMTKIMNLPGSLITLGRCLFTDACQRALTMLDSLEMVVAQFLSNGRQGVTAKP